MSSSGSRREEPPLRARVSAAGEQLVASIRAHADAVMDADDAEARNARASIISAMHEYSWAIEDTWDEVVWLFPSPQTLPEREGRDPAPRQVHLRVTYHLQVLDKDRLIDLANEEGCGPASDPAEAVAALYDTWEPSETSGLVSPSVSYHGGFEQAPT
jgi:hypothetical protein